MYGLGMLKGLTVTMRNLVLPGRLFTLHQYPDRRIGLLGLAKASGSNVLGYVLSEPRMAVKALTGMATVEDRQPRHPRFRGEEFTWYEERCTACASCARYCPLGIIRIVSRPSGGGMQEGEKYALEVFDIDMGRCMFCGLCVEACPYDALHMGSGFEEGEYRRRDLVITVDRLRSAPKRPSHWYRPQLEAKRGHPRDDEEVTWREAGRHQRPSSDEQKQRWVRR